MPQVICTGCHRTQHWRATRGSSISDLKCGTPGCPGPLARVVMAEVPVPCAGPPDRLVICGSKLVISVRGVPPTCSSCGITRDVQLRAKGHRLPRCAAPGCSKRAKFPLVFQRPARVLTRVPYDPAQLQAALPGTMVQRWADLAVMDALDYVLPGQGICPHDHRIQLLAGRHPPCGTFLWLEAPSWRGLSSGSLDWSADDARPLARVSLHGVPGWGSVQVQRCPRCQQLLPLEVSDPAQLAAGIWPMTRTPMEPTP